MAYPSASHVYSPYDGQLVDANTTTALNATPIAQFAAADISGAHRIRGALWFVSNCANLERLRVAKEIKRLVWRAKKAS